VEVIPKYLMEIPEKYGVEIDIMIEAKFKELSLFHLYKKYPELNCAVSGEVPSDLFVPKPTVPRSELQKIKKNKKAIEKKELKVNGKKVTAEDKSVSKCKINKPNNDHVINKKTLDVKSKMEFIENRKPEITSIPTKKKKIKQTPSKNPRTKLNNNCDFTNDKTSNIFAVKNKSVELDKVKKDKQKSISQTNMKKTEMIRKSSRKRKYVSYASSENSDE